MRRTVFPGIGLAQLHRIVFSEPVLDFRMFGTSMHRSQPRLIHRGNGQHVVLREPKELAADEDLVIEIEHVRSVEVTVAYYPGKTSPV